MGSVSEFIRLAQLAAGSPKPYGFCVLTVALLSSGLVLPQRAQAGRVRVSTNTSPQDVASDGLLWVEVAPTIADAELFPKWIRDRNPSLEDRFPEKIGHEQWIVVKIEGSTYDYRVRVVVMQDGEPVGVTPEPVACECNSERLLEVIDEGIAGAVEQFEAVPAEASPVESSEGDESVPRTGSEPEPKARKTLDPKSDHLGVLGSLGYTGIGLGLLGGAALAAGIPLAVQPDEVRGEPGLKEKRSTKALGITVSVLGAMAIAAGVSSVVVDVLRQKKRMIVVRPMGGPQFVGILFSVKR